jgi:hypothetical protein
LAPAGTICGAHSAASPCFTVWSDPSYSTYFHSQQQAIAAEVSGRY